MKPTLPALLPLAALLTATCLLVALPAARAQSDQPPGDRQVPGQPTPGGPTVPPGAPGTPGGGTPAAEPNAAAVILTDVAGQLGLVGSVTQQSADELAAQHAAQAQGEVVPIAAPVPLPLQYAFVGMAAGEFETDHEQTLSASLHEFKTGTEAWGYWSRIRTGEVVQVTQDARYDGQKLRFWQGPFCGELSFTPPNALQDQRNLTTIARALAARIRVRGNPPTLIGALPTRALVADSVIYFHAAGSGSDDLLSLSDETEGIAASYDVDNNRETLVIVRYPTVRDAQNAWRSFVQNHLGEQLDGETGGLRFMHLANQGWSGIASRGTVCAFVIGALTKDELRLMLVQAIGRA